MEVDGGHLGAGLGGEQERGPAGTAAQVEDARPLGQRTREGEQLPGGGIGAGTLPRKPVVQGEEGVGDGCVVSQRGNP